MFIKDLRIISLLEKYKPIYSLKYLLMLSNWDIETYMPKYSIESRGKVTATMESLIQRMSLDNEFEIDVKSINPDDSKLTDSERMIVKRLQHSLNKYKKLPRSFVEEYANLTSTASTIWSKAKLDNDLALFLPYLSKIFNATRKMADFLEYENHPYEALIEDYEPEMSITDYDEYFKELKKTLSLFDFSKSNNLKDLPTEYSTDQLKDICRNILLFFKADNNFLRLDESSHPFTNSLGINDIRLTTNYNKNSPFNAIYSTIHEFGHGLFGHQTIDELEFTPLYNDISYAVHESQSRFWENMIGKNESFLDWLRPHINKLGDGYEDLTTYDIEGVVNYVKPSLIRIEADELTYHYHILIRYEIEKALLDGSIKINEAKEFWDSKYYSYLGIKPSKDSEGILQDIHWSMGYIGYFPSYSFGTTLSSSIKNKMEDNIGNIDDILHKTDGIDKIQLWLKENIHRYGGTYTYKDISLKLGNKKINIKPWTDYAKTKFSKLLI